MGLHEALHRMFGRLDVPTRSCLKERDLTLLREAVNARAPGMCTWYALRYPGDQTLPVYLLPLVPPLPDHVQPAIRELKEAMHHGGVLHLPTDSVIADEHRQEHVWLAMLAKGIYLPIGCVEFVLERRLAEPHVAALQPQETDELRLATPDSGESEEIVDRWWLHQPWLRPAYRCQKIFRNSVPYFEQWHPGFLLKEPPVVLARALKDYPEHISYLEDSWYSGA